MNTELLPPSAVATNPELGVIAALLTALTDPEATKARLAEIGAKIAEHNALATDAKAALTKLEADTAAAGQKIEADRLAAAEDIKRQRTQLDVNAAAIQQRAEATDKRSTELDTLAGTLGAREAELNRRESAFREHADAISALKA